MRSCRHFVLLSCMLGTSGEVGAREMAVESWSQPGVTFARYRGDAVECGSIGYNRNVSDDEPAKRFLRGFRTADDDLNTDMPTDERLQKWRDVVRRTNPDRRKRELHAIQVGDVERCLAKKGYIRFTLTREESEALKRYPVGSAARHRYLHTLASASR